LVKSYMTSLSLDFRKKWGKSGRLLKSMYICFFPPVRHVPPPTFHKPNVLLNELNKYAINKFRIQYWI
jgi:hypothetical protein